MKDAALPVVLIVLGLAWLLNSLDWLPEIHWLWILGIERFAGQLRGRVRSRRDAVLGAARRSDWASEQASQHRNASLLDRTRRAAPITGRLRCCSSLPWNHHGASLRLAFGRFSGLRAPLTDPQTALAGAGVAILALDGITKSSIVAGPLLILAGMLSFFRQYYGLGWRFMVPIMLIAAGIFMLVARSPAIPESRTLARRFHDRGPNG